MVGAAGVVLVPLAGCSDGETESSGPQERSYTLTITSDSDTLEMQIDPAGDVEDVIQINVGDTVKFTVENEADSPVGFHNHANDEQVVIDAGGAHETSFEATEAMTGRQEIEGWIATADGDDSGDGHGGDATTLAIIEVRPRGK